MSQVQNMINANAPMVFTYKYSRPQVQRIAHPVNIEGDIVTAVESDTGRWKRFKLDGIHFPSPLENKIQNMINTNSCMIFTYKYSNPNLHRAVYPVKIENNVVIGNDASTGQFKSFKLDGIQFHDYDLVSRIQVFLNANAFMAFNYKHSNSHINRIVRPICIEGDCMVAMEVDTCKYKSFKLDGIQLI
jgi:hypothetical protein